MKKIFGKALKAYRKKLGLTQKNMAARIDTKQPNLSAYEKGINNPDIDRMLKIFSQLNINPYAFFLYMTELTCDNPLSIDECEHIAELIIKYKKQKAELVMEALS